ncbi:MAG TPA: class I SAM-dependent methyltransferase [Chthoniobacterales bacterium]|nr:class I SAM-dependent methyltransferase [Chthoniobacterales bacterium]
MKLLRTRRKPIILDVGCSSGFLVEDLLREIPQAAIVGADYLPDVVLRAARRVQSAPFLQFDLRNCPLAGDCLDGVTALNVLEHIDDDFNLKLCERFREFSSEADSPTSRCPRTLEF